jgi:serine/threonine protein kinase
LLGDLKPANVVLDYTGKLRVIDFGLAHYGRTGQRQSMALVTPGFSPPEQWAGDPLDERSDIYAWAATLYWCLAPGPLERFRFDFPPLSNTSSGLNELLLRCLKSDRSGRFQRVDQVIQEIGGLQRNTGLGPGRSSPSEILSQLYRERKQKFDF